MNEQVKLLPKLLTCAGKPISCENSTGKQPLLPPEAQHEQGLWIFLGTPYLNDILALTNIDVVSVHRNTPVSRRIDASAWNKDRLMKKPLYACLITLCVSLPVHSTDTWQSSCKSSSQLARSIMRLRQNGKDMSELVDSIGKTVGNPDAQKMATNLVLAAYKDPRYQTAEMQQKSVDDFANDVYLRCAEELQGKSP